MRGLPKGSKIWREGGYNLAFMEVGESKTFFAEERGTTVQTLRNRLNGKMLQRRDMRFQSMQVPGGVWVKRIA